MNGGLHSPVCIVVYAQCAMRGGEGGHVIFLRHGSDASDSDLIFVHKKFYKIMHGLELDDSMALMRRWCKRGSHMRYLRLYARCSRSTEAWERPWVVLFGSFTPNFPFLFRRPLSASPSCEGPLRSYNSFVIPFACEPVNPQDVWRVGMSKSTTCCTSH